MRYQVTYAVDSLDPNPIVKAFETEWEAIEFLEDEVQRRMDHIMQHSTHGISEEEFEEIEETEYSLARIDKI